MWPVAGYWEVRQPGVTVVRAAWADALDEVLNGILGGTHSLKALYLDGIGWQSSPITDGLQVDVNGTNVLNVHLGGLEMANPGGKISSVSNIEAAVHLKALFGDVESLLGALRGRHLVGRINAGPTIAKNAGSLGGGGSDAQILGSDIAGLITLTTGGGAGANGTLATVTFEVPYPGGQAPKTVLLFPQNGPAYGVTPGVQPVGNNVTETGFLVFGGPFPNPNVQYVYGYLVVG